MAAKKCDICLIFSQGYCQTMRGLLELGLLRNEEMPRLKPDAADISWVRGEGRVNKGRVQGCAFFYFSLCYSCYFYSCRKTWLLC